jgi:hypothetical protein
MAKVLTLSLSNWANFSILSLFFHLINVWYYLSTFGWNILWQAMEYFCHVTSMVCFKINNGLLTLNMGLAKKAIESSIVWMFESKKNLKDAFYHPLCNQCSKCLMLLDNNYNIFKNVEMGGNCILRNIWWKLTSQSILNIWQTCVEMAEVLYINIHHSTMIEK